MSGKLIRRAAPPTRPARDQTTPPPCTQNPAMWDDTLDGRYESEADRRTRHHTAINVCLGCHQLTVCPGDPTVGGVVAAHCPCCHPRRTP